MSIQIIQRQSGKMICSALRIVTALALVCTVSSCGQSDKVNNAASTNTQGSQVSEERLAGSLSERIRFMLDSDSDGLKPEQIEMLNRALENDGKVSHADYEQAWQNYQQCMVSKGYKPEPLMRYQDGLYASTTTRKTMPSQEQEEKFQQDFSECRAGYVTYVDELYRLATGNHGLFVEPTVAIVQCLKEKNLVPSSYTPQQFSEERDHYLDLLSKYSEEGLTDANARARRESFTPDLGRADVMTCMVSNGWDPPSDEREPWNPLG